MTRKLILHMMTTQDGYIADPRSRLTWEWTNWDEEMRAYYNPLFASAGGLMFGRTIFEELVPAWTSIAEGRGFGTMEITESDLVFARRIVELPKTVVSRTLRTAQDATVLSGDGDLRERVAALKAEPGGDILLYCGPALAATLTHLGVIDEYQIYVHPVVLGGGTALFGALRAPVRLKLADVTVFGSGSLAVRYGLE